MGGDDLPSDTWDPSEPGSRVSASTVGVPSATDEAGQATFAPLFDDGADTMAELLKAEQLTDEHRTVATVVDPAAAEVAPSRYQDLEELGKGGLGSVARAYDRHLGREVAVKRLHRVTLPTRRRFERELRLGAQLEHPGIVPVYDGGSDGDGPYITMRLIEGTSLSEAIATRSTLQERLELLPHLIQACQAVAFAHSRGVIHRDLKPDNVMVGDFGQTLVIDWGLATRLGLGESTEFGGADPADVRLTRVGTVMGTPSFMPPEQARGQQTDKRSDVYALGAILYTLLSGDRPYLASRDPVQDLAEELPPAPLATLVSQVPADLVAVAERAMAMDPEDRYPDARDVAEELLRFQQGLFVDAYAYSPMQRLVRLVRRHRLAVSAATVIVLTTVVALALISRANVQLAAQKRSAEAARDEARALGLKDRLRSDRLAIDKAALVVDRDPGEALHLLASLSPETEVGAEVRTLAAQAVANQPVHWLTRGPAFSVDGSHGRWVVVDAEGVHFFAGLEKLTTVPVGFVARRVVSIEQGAIVCGDQQVARVGLDGQVVEHPIDSCPELVRHGDGARVNQSNGFVLLGTDALEQDRVEIDADATGIAFAADDTTFWLDSPDRIEFHGPDGLIARTPLAGVAYELEEHPRALQVASVGEQGLFVVTAGAGRLRSERLAIPGMEFSSRSEWVDDHTLAVIGSTSELVMVDTRRGVVDRTELPGHPVELESLADGRLLVRTDDSSLLLVDPASMEVVRAGVVPAPISDWRVQGVQAVFLTQRGVALQHLDDGDGRAIEHHGGRVYDLLPTDDGLWITGAAGTSRIASPHLTEPFTGSSLVSCGGSVWIGGLESGVKRVGEGTIVPTEGRVTALACLDQATLFVGTSSGSLLAIDVKTGEPEARTRVATAFGVRSLRTTAGGVVVGGDGLFRWRPGEDPELLEGGGSYVWGSAGAYSTSDGAVLWEGRELARFSELITGVVSVGERWLVGTGSGAVHIVSPTATVAAPVSHTQYVHAFAAHPSGFALTGAWDATARLWDLREPEPYSRVLPGHEDAVVVVAWGEHAMYTADRAGVVRSWRQVLPLSSAELREELESLGAAHYPESQGSRRLEDR